jgi:orotate phosphoribosyltransferase
LRKNILSNLRQEFIAFSVNAGVIRFGDFVTKAGRNSPYFFNAGLFNDGANLGKLAAFYADTLINSGVEFDMLFGPAYKGITLASATAVALAARVVTCHLPTIARKPKTTAKAAPSSALN